MLGRKKRSKRGGNRSDGEETGEGPSHADGKRKARTSRISRDSDSPLPSSSPSIKTRATTISVRPKKSKTRATVVKALLTRSPSESTGVVAATVRPKPAPINDPYEVQSDTKNFSKYSLEDGGDSAAQLFSEMREGFSRMKSPRRDPSLHLSLTALGNNNDRITLLEHEEEEDEEELRNKRDSVMFFSTMRLGFDKMKFDAGGSEVQPGSLLPGHGPEQDARRRLDGVKSERAEEKADRTEQKQNEQKAKEKEKEKDTPSQQPKQPDTEFGKLRDGAGGDQKEGGAAKQEEEEDGSDQNRGSVFLFRTMSEGVRSLMEREGCEGEQKMKRVLPPASALAAGVPAGGDGGENAVTGSVVLFQQMGEGFLKAQLAAAEKEREKDKEKDNKEREKEKEKDAEKEKEKEKERDKEKGARRRHSNADDEDDADRIRDREKDKDRQKAGKGGGGGDFVISPPINVRIGTYVQDMLTEEMEREDAEGRRGTAGGGFVISPPLNVRIGAYVADMLKAEMEKEKQKQEGESGFVISPPLNVRIGAYVADMLKAEMEKEEREREKEKEQEQDPGEERGFVISPPLNVRVGAYVEDMLKEEMEKEKEQEKQNPVSRGAHFDIGEPIAMRKGVNPLEAAAAAARPSSPPRDRNKGQQQQGSSTRRVAASDFEVGAPIAVRKGASVEEMMEELDRGEKEKGKEKEKAGQHFEIGPPLSVKKGETLEDQLQQLERMEKKQRGSGRYHHHHQSGKKMGNKTWIGDVVKRKMTLGKDKEKERDKERDGVPKRRVMQISSPHDGTFRKTTGDHPSLLDLVSTLLAEIERQNLLEEEQEAEEKRKGGTEIFYQQLTEGAEILDPAVPQLDEEEQRRQILRLRKKRLELALKMFGGEMPDDMSGTEMMFSDLRKGAISQSSPNIYEALKAERDEQKKATQISAPSEENEAAAKQVSPAEVPPIPIPAPDDQDAERDTTSDGKGSGYLALEMIELRRIRAEYMKELVGIEKHIDALLARKREIEEKWRATFPKKSPPARADGEKEAVGLDAAGTEMEPAQEVLVPDDGTKGEDKEEGKEKEKEEEECEQQQEDKEKENEKSGRGEQLNGGEPGSPSRSPRPSDEEEKEPPAEEGGEQPKLSPSPTPPGAAYQQEEEEAEGEGERGEEGGAGSVVEIKQIGNTTVKVRPHKLKGTAEIKSALQSPKRERDKSRRGSMIVLADSGAFKPVSQRWQHK